MPSRVPRARAPRPSFVMTLSASAVVVLAACSSSEPSGVTSCPDTPPSAGAPCSGSFRCDYCSSLPYQAAVRSCVGDHFESEPSSCNPPPACPPIAPTVGAACSRGPGFGPLRCTYADTCDRLADDAVRGPIEVTCEGTWKVVSGDYVAKCPLDAPTEGTSCVCGVHHFGDCGYDDCFGRAATTAHCDVATGLWKVTSSTCNPPPPDGGPVTDVGPDDGGSDAGSDAASDVGSDGG